jgi:hypothetical protein
MTGPMDTLGDRMRQMHAAGWTEQFEVSGRGICCVACEHWATPEYVKVDEVFRFEGASDPEDQAVLFAISLPCGHRGVLPAAYGKDVAPEIAEVLKRLNVSDH